MKPTPSSPAPLLRHLWLAIAAVALLTSGIAAADKDGCRHYNPEEMGEEIADYLEDELDLEDEQEDGIAEILAKAFEEERTLRKVSPLSTAWGQSSLSAEALQEVLEKQHSRAGMAERRSQLLAIRAEALANIHALLTPEQRAKALPMLTRALGMGKHGGKKGRHAGYGKYGKHGGGGCHHD